MADLGRQQEDVHMMSPLAQTMNRGREQLCVFLFVNGHSAKLSGQIPDLWASVGSIFEAKLTLNPLQ